MKFKKLREECLKTNQDIMRAGLVLLTWGNASISDFDSGGIMAIKPSGVPYEDLRPEDIVVLEIESGIVIGGSLRPSSDTPTHLELYRSYPQIKSVIHTHSHYALCFAQAELPIACMGTTHSDFFFGEIPVTRGLTEDEVNEGYELNTGKVIVETFKERECDPLAVPGVLVSRHGPFAWGDSARHAVENAVVLEEVARLGVDMGLLEDAARYVTAPDFLVKKHYYRKHGPNGYYGQKRD